MKGKEYYLQDLMVLLPKNNLLDDIEKVGDDSNLPKQLKIITDARNAIFEFMPEDIDALANSVEKYMGKFVHIKEALIQSDPFVTALTVLYQLKLSKLENFEYQIFSTIEAATDWIYH
jgi:hypothetical protein